MRRPGLQYLGVQGECGITTALRLGVPPHLVRDGTATFFNLEFRCSDSLGVDDLDWSGSELCLHSID